MRINIKKKKKTKEEKIIYTVGASAKQTGNQKGLCDAKSAVYSTGVCWLLRAAKDPIAARE